MAKIRISASISEKVKQEAIIVAQKRGLKFSQLIERALINKRDFNTRKYLTRYK